MEIATNLFYMFRSVVMFSCFLVTCGMMMMIFWSRSQAAISIEYEFEYNCLPSDKRQ